MCPLADGSESRAKWTSDHWHSPPSQNVSNAGSVSCWHNTQIEQLCEKAMSWSVYLCCWINNPMTSDYRRQAVNAMLLGWKLSSGDNLICYVYSERFFLHYSMYNIRTGWLLTHWPRGAAQKENRPTDHPCWKPGLHVFWMVRDFYGSPSCRNVHGLMKLESIVSDKGLQLTTNSCKWYWGRHIAKYTINVRKTPNWRPRSIWAPPFLSKRVFITK